MADSVALPEGFTLDGPMTGTYKREKDLPILLASTGREVADAAADPRSQEAMFPRLEELDAAIAAAKDPKVKAILVAEKAARTGGMSGGLPEGFVVDAAPTGSSGVLDRLNDRPVKAASTDSMRASPPRSEVLLNAAKLGLMSVPGLPGSMEAVRAPVKGAINQKLGIEPGGVIDSLDRFSMALNPLNAIEGVVRATRQAMGQEAKTALPSAEELATKVFGYDKDKEAVFGLDKKLARGVEFFTSMLGGPTTSLVRTGIKEGLREGAKEAAKKTADAAAISTSAALGGEAAERAGTSPIVGELGSIVPYALVRRYFNPQQNVAALKDAVTGEGAAINSMFTRQAEAQLQKGIQEYSPAIANIKEAVGLQNKVNEALKAADEVSQLRISAGQASGSPRTVADELAARRSSTASVAAALNTDAENTKAILSYLTADAGPGNTSRRMAVKKVIDDHNAALASVQGQEQQVRQDMGRLVERLTPKTAAEERGALLVDLRAQEQAKEKAITQQLYGAASNEAKNVGATFDRTAIDTVAARLAANPILQYDATNMPSVVRNIMGDKLGPDVERAMSVVSPDKAEQLRQRLSAGRQAMAAKEASARPLPFDDIAAMKQAVNQDIAIELRSTNPNKRQRLRALTELSHTIDGAIAESKFPEVAKLYGAANDYYRTTYAPKFNKGINAKLAMTDSFGQQRVLDEKVLDQYMGTSNGANQFLTLFGKNAEAMGVMDDHILDRFSNAAVKDGILNDAAAARFLARHGDVLTKLEASGLGTVGKLRDAKQVAQVLADRETALTMQGKQLAKNDLTNALGTTEHEVIVMKAIADPYAMIKLTKALGEDGSKSLASSVLRDIGSKFTYSPESGKLGINHEAFSKWLNTNQQSLKIMLRAGYGAKDGQEFFQRLQDANRLLAIQERVPRISQAESASMVGKDPLTQRVGFSFRSLFNMIRAIKGGRTSEADAAVALGGQAGSFMLTKQYNALVQRMMSDPESSKYLLQLAQDGAKKTMTRQEVAQQSKAIAGLIGKLGYIYSGGRYYGPSMRAIAPVIATQQAQEQ